MKETTHRKARGKLTFISVAWTHSSKTRYTNFECFQTYLFYPILSPDMLKNRLMTFCPKICRISLCQTADSGHRSWWTTTTFLAYVNPGLLINQYYDFLGLSTRWKCSDLTQKGVFPVGLHDPFSERMTAMTNMAWLIYLQPDKFI